MTDIAIFSMEKAGSTSVMGTIKSAGLDAHRIYPGNMDSFDLGSFNKVITLVREPIARNISAMFEFNRKEIYDDLPFIWFDDFILPSLGIDVYAKRFNKKNGWQIYDDRLLVIRTESITSQLCPALYYFLGIDQEHFTLWRRNRGSEKYGSRYDRFVSTARFDKEELDAYYDTVYAKHFYYVKELKELRKKWKK